MKLEDKLLERVDILAEKMNNVSSHLWDSMIKYEVTKGILEVGFGILIIIATIALVRWFIKEKGKGVDGLFYELAPYGKSETGLGIILSVITCMSVILSFFCFIFVIPSGILHITSPEIYAIKDIISEINNSK